ncbi:MAG: hypothetical protein R3C59_04720 [Planctomycetaceae bacterium]
MKRWLKALLRGETVFPGDRQTVDRAEHLIDLFVTRLEPRIVLNADFTLIGGALGDVLNLTNFDGATTEVTVEESVDGSDYLFRLDSGTWNGDSSPAGIDVVGDTLQVDKALVTEAIRIDDSDADANPMNNVDVDFGTIDFSSGGAAALFFDVDDVRTVVVSGDVALGNTSLSVDAGRDVFVTGSVNTIDGDVTLIGNVDSLSDNGDGTFAVTRGNGTGDFDGVSLSGAQIVSSGSGNIELIGGGGNSSTMTRQVGVQITNSDVLSTSDAADAGAISVIGQAGYEGTELNYGVSIFSNGDIESNRGEIFVQGTGAGEGKWNWGVNRKCYLGNSFRVR